MSLSKLMFLSLGSALVLSACGSSDSGGGGTGGTGGTTGEACNAIDFSQYTSGDPVSLKNDLMPIFGMSCANGQCHNERDKKAGLYLGVRCKWDNSIKQCVFPDVVNPDDSQPQPLTQTIVDNTHASLIDVAKTVNDGTVKRALAGDPEHSFVIEKLNDTHNDKGYACTNQDPSRGSLPCGNAMPPVGVSLCEDSRTKFDLIARWIAQGAQNN